MRTTLELPDELMRAVKVRAAQTDRTLTETIAELIRQGLVGAADGSAARVTLPLIRTPRKASADDLTPERIAAILTAADITDFASKA